MIFGKKKLRSIKVLMVSARMEITLLIIQIICIPILAFLSSSWIPISKFDLFEICNVNFNITIPLPISNSNELFQWLDQSINQNYFTKKITSFQPFNYLYIGQSRLPNDNCSFENFQCRANQSLNNQSSINTTDCSVDQCPEFYKRTNLQFVKNGKFRNYEFSDFYLLLNSASEINKATLTISENKGWIDNDTTAIYVHLLLYMPIYNIFLSNRILIEMNDGNVVSSDADWNYHIDLSQQTIYIIVLSIFAGYILLYTFKVMIETTIIVNRFMIFFQYLNILLQFILVSLISIKATASKNLSINTLLNSKSFLLIEKLVLYESIITKIFIILLLFLPFKFLQLLSWVKKLKFIVVYFQILFRTLPTLFWFMMNMLVITVFASLAQFYFMHDYFVEIRDYTQLLSDFFFIKIHQTKGVKMIIRDGYGDVLASMKFTILFIELLLFIYLVSLIYIALNSSYIFHTKHKTPLEKDALVKTQDTEIKVEKFLRDLRIHFKLKKEFEGNRAIDANSKVLVWLNAFTKDNFYEETVLMISDSGIKLLDFYEFQQVYQFLSFLFRLKPNILSKQSGEKFRIIMNYREDKYQETENIITWLRNIGSKVPIILFHQETEFNHNLVLQLKRKYTFLYFLKKPEELIKFALMNCAVQEFASYLENRTFASISSLDNSDDEQSLLDVEN